MKNGILCTALITTVFICSSCNGTGRGTGVASGGAVSETVVTAEEDQTEKKNWKDKEGIDWVMENEVTEEKDGVIYHAYLSEDGKYSWIHMAEPGSGKPVDTLAFPDKVQGAELVRIGKRVKEDDYWDIFGNSVEPYHLWDGWPRQASDEERVVSKKGIRQVICPASVKEITGASFCGFRDLESIVLPENLKKIPEYLLFNCISLQKVVLPQKPDFAKAGWQYMAECNRIKEAVLPEGNSSYCMKNGMLLSKDKKILYQVMVPEKTVKIPEGVTEIATHAVNADCFTKIQSVEIPSTVKKLDHEAILDVPEYHDRDTAIRKIAVDGKNPFLAESGGCVYEKKSGTLVAVVCADGTVKLPGDVRKLGDAYSKVGKPIEQLMVPDTFGKIDGEQWLFNGLDTKSSKKMKDTGYIQFQRLQ